LNTIYAPQWPYARIDQHLIGFEGQGAAERYAAQAIALLSHGRKPAARRFVALAKQATDNTTAAPQLAVATLLINGESKKRRAQLWRRLAYQQQMSVPTELIDPLDAARRDLRRYDYKAALNHLKKIPSALRTLAGPDVQLLFAYLLEKNQEIRSTIDTLQELVRTEEVFVSQHPEVYYLLARAQDAASHYHRAVRNMRTYAESAIATAQMLRPVQASE
jgi:hypothetical protein